VITTLLIATLLAAASGASAADSAEPAAERGRGLIARYHCGTCHTVPGVPAARGTLAASLERYARRSYIAGRIPHTREALARWIESPAALAPDTTMPDMGVSPRDAADMAAYLHTLR
jgi:cytochrome c